MLRLPRLLPRPLALELLLTGRVLAASEALEHGLVNQVVPGGQLLEAAQALASRIVASAPLAVAAILEVLDATEGQSVASGYATLRSGRLPRYAAMLARRTRRKGPAAFAERRPPAWKGR